MSTFLFEIHLSSLSCLKPAAFLTSAGRVNTEITVSFLESPANLDLVQFKGYEILYTITGTDEENIVGVIPL